MPALECTEEEFKIVEPLLQAYAAHSRHITLSCDQLVLAISSAEKMQPPLVHSIKSRVKNPDHLRDKLVRKLREAEADKVPFEITTTNLLTEITDLVGVRVLHLYTKQIAEIDAALRSVFDEAPYELIEGPFARTWDDESRDFFKTCSIETQPSPSMYTSVHYVVGTTSRTRVTAEIQVRTLMEEVWGEVDHMINYPHPNRSLPCREQLKVLARVTSSASRLVDSIFATVDDHDDGKVPTK